MQKSVYYYAEIICQNIITYVSGNIDILSF